MKILAGDLSRHLTKENALKAKYMCKCSLLLVNRKMQVKIPVRFHCLFLKR